VAQRAALEMYGLDGTAFNGVGLDFMAVIHPEDRERFPHALEGSQSPSVEQHNLFRIIRPDTGELRWIAGDEVVERGEVKERPRRDQRHDLVLVDRRQLAAEEAGAHRRQ
jgi:hypothetical protein